MHYRSLFFVLIESQGQGIAEKPEWHNIKQQHAHRLAATSGVRRCKGTLNHKRRRVRGAR